MRSQQAFEIGDGRLEKLLFVLQQGELIFQVNVSAGSAVVEPVVACQAALSPILSNAHSAGHFGQSFPLLWRGKDSPESHVASFGLHCRAPLLLVESASDEVRGGDAL